MNEEDWVSVLLGSGGCCFVKNVLDVFKTDVAHVEMGIKVMTIPSFRNRDNSVHLYECSPFWVGIFITFNKENYHVYCFM